MFKLRDGNRCALFGVALAAAVGANAQPVAGESGLRSPDAEALWPRWQGRILVGGVSPAWRNLGWEQPQGVASTRQLEALSLLGDYYFGAPSDNSRSLGGFRATSGLVIGARKQRSLEPLSRPGLWSPSMPAADPGGDDLMQRSMPYLGLGYTNASPRNRWSFSADIGLIARSPGSAIKLGRVVGGGMALDDFLREMRMSPLINLGVSYSF